MDWLNAVVLSYLAGLAIPIGGAIALAERIRPQWLENEFRHSVIAFGGGALLSAVALVLVPEGGERLGPVWSPILMLAGASAMLGLDFLLAKNETAAGQLVAMLTDFVPEALALGAAFAGGGSTGSVIALMIGLQNLPEGFNAYREMVANSKLRRSTILIAFNLLALLGPVAGAVGYFILADNEQTIGSIELIAAGGILYLIFQDIAPQAKLERHWAPPLGAIFGFALGLVGHLVIH